MVRYLFFFLLFFIGYAKEADCQDLKKELSEVRKHTSSKIDSLQKLMSDYIAKQKLPSSTDSLLSQKKIEDLDKLIDQIKIEEMGLDLQFIKRYLNTSFAMDLMSQNIWVMLLPSM